VCATRCCAVSGHVTMTSSWYVDVSATQWLRQVLAVAVVIWPVTLSGCTLTLTHTHTHTQTHLAAVMSSLSTRQSVTKNHCRHLDSNIVPQGTCSDLLISDIVIRGIITISISISLLLLIHNVKRTCLQLYETLGKKIVKSIVIHVIRYMDYEVKA